VGAAANATQDRSLINLAMLSALNRPHEFKAHTKGALTNGCTREEIREVLLQVAVYCGMPAGVEAFRLAASDEGIRAGKTVMSGSWSVPAPSGGEEDFVQTQGASHRAAGVIEQNVE